MGFDVSYDIEWVTSRISRPRGVSRVLRRPRLRSVDDLSITDQSIAFALAQARTIAGELLEEVRVEGDALYMPHRVVAALDAESAQTLGLPSIVDLTFKTDVEGSLGSSSFRLLHRWTKYGRPQVTRRVGSILETEAGIRRLPIWLLEAIEVSEGFESKSELSAHWEALARFRQAIQPEVELVDDDQVARVSMTDFLRGLEVRLADSFGLMAHKSADGLFDFEPVPFSKRGLEDVPEDEVTEIHSELGGEALKAFQDRFRNRGALPAYRIGGGSYVVVDRSASIALEVMAKKQHAAPETRDEFVRNPRVAIGEATAARMRENGELEGLAPEAEEEAIETAAMGVFTETKEFSERVIGTTIYQSPQLPDFETTETTWLPQEFDTKLVDALNTMDVVRLDRVITSVRDAVSDGRAIATVDGLEIPASEASIVVLESIRDERKAGGESDVEEEEDELTGPVILDTKENFSDLGWYPEIKPRDGQLVSDVPKAVTTPLKEHQHDGLRWQKECWSAGLPGVLNADEQGLGKTLQTIAFLRCLRDWQANLSGERVKQPMLVVAPTSLLLTWEAEVRQHLDEDGLGRVIRLFGESLGGFKVPGTTSVDTDSGDMKLDLSMLVDAIAEGTGDRFWVLTTYATLTNYHHSLARIPFAVAVFDEIQALKNPGSLRSFAARAIHADFRIGLTGTPIENRTSDLWALLDQLAPGALGTLQQFNQRFAEPDPSSMRVLYEHVFDRVKGLPQLALRRMKAQVARDLPPKLRRLHPRLMPSSQTVAYDAAKLKLKRGRGALKALQHIRSVSVHPGLTSHGPRNDFVRSSGRVAAAFDILQRIRDRDERALVFIEERVVQHWFINVARREFGLAQIDVINGSTPIPSRQKIVERFQRHIEEDRGFDLLVLGTRAAGIGLTLTAATHVIHVSRWWNPAVEEQCNDRVHRIGQERPVTIHIPMAVHPDYREHSFDCLLHSLMNRKRKLADAALWPMGETASDITSLQRSVAEETKHTMHGDPIYAALLATFDRDGSSPPEFESDGSVAYS